MGIGLAEAVVNRFGASTLLPFALTGEGMGESVRIKDSVDVRLIPPSRREEMWEEVREFASEAEKTVVAIDFTHPDAALPNVRFYSQERIPFVMGTTGGDMDVMERTVMETNDETYAVIAPNMGKPIVVFQAMVDSAAKAFPNALKGYKLDVVESHQSGKADTSGTAKAVVESMGGLGLDGSTEKIQMIREPEQQVAEMGVPKEHLGHHAFHTYRIASPDNSVEIVLEHNICGSAVYHDGTLDALQFLLRQRENGNPKRLWNMMDILSHK